ncbi:MAG: helix-hairpin-helix domain-containing protein, partial [Chitinophagales bacterium]|nr:helix-hairpin-helix domain-containing protein [Chitinophagales bacterium]
MIKKLGIFLTFLAEVFLLNILSAQQPDDTDVQEIIENVSRSEDSEEFSFDASIDDLENLKKKPLNINTASAAELSEIVLLSPQQINELQKYIGRHGKLISIYELQAVPLWDIKTIKEVLPYIKVDVDIRDLHVPLKDLFKKGNILFVSRFQQQIEISRGYIKPEDPTRQYYLGQPFRLFARFRYTYGTQMSYGFTADKDAGEEFFTGSNKRGFDFYSGHFFIRNRKLIRALALGDYELRLGQGLIMWTGFGFRKSPAVMLVKRESPKVRPYTSMNEFMFLRGGALTIGKKNWEATAFISYRQLDANVVQNAASDTAINEEEFFSSISQTGYHRTTNEISRRENLGQITTGGNVSYNKKAWHIGANALYMRFMKPYIKDLSPYARFDFAAQQLFNASIDYHAIFKNIHF